MSVFTNKKYPRQVLAAIQETDMGFNKYMESRSKKIWNPGHFFTTTTLKKEMSMIEIGIYIDNYVTTFPERHKAKFRGKSKQKFICCQLITISFLFILTNLYSPLLVDFQQCSFHLFKRFSIQIHANVD